jgi:hypothetical protein
MIIIIIIITAHEDAVSFFCGHDKNEFVQLVKEAEEEP